jgi:hypothetical protein
MSVYLIIPIILRIQPLFSVIPFDSHRLLWAITAESTVVFRVGRAGYLQVDLPKSPVMEALAPMDELEALRARIPP